MKLLDGIHEEAADLLKDKAISPKAIHLLKQVACVRQIEIAELMVSANNFSGLCGSFGFGHAKRSVGTTRKTES
jgi:hypothetical protein